MSFLTFGPWTKDQVPPKREGAFPAVASGLRCERLDRTRRGLSRPPAKNTGPLDPGIAGFPGVLCGLARDAFRLRPVRPRTVSARRAHWPVVARKIFTSEAAFSLSAHSSSVVWSFSSNTFFFSRSFACAKGMGRDGTTSRTKST